MLCPQCNKELKFEGEFYSSIAELNSSGEIEGEVCITLSCAECNEELGEYTIELELDITNFSEDHEDENEHPGASATVHVSCICGKSISYAWSNYDEPEDVYKELGLA
jgi:hypothetical protein